VVERVSDSRFPERGEDSKVLSRPRDASWSCCPSVHHQRSRPSPHHAVPHCLMSSALASAIELEEHQQGAAYSGSLLRDTQPVMSQWHDPPDELHMRALLTIVLVWFQSSQYVVMWRRLGVISGSRGYDDGQRHYMCVFGSILKCDRKRISPR
jgi:hypothetical protein